MAEIPTTFTRLYLMSYCIWPERALRIIRHLSSISLIQCPMLTVKRAVWGWLKTKQKNYYMAQSQVHAPDNTHGQFVTSQKWLNVARNEPRPLLWSQFLWFSALSCLNPKREPRVKNYPYFLNALHSYHPSSSFLGDSRTKVTVLDWEILSVIAKQIHTIHTF